MRVHMGNVLAIFTLFAGLAATPADLQGSQTASTDDDVTTHPCPDYYPSNTRMWHNIPNVGQVQLIFRPPQVIAFRFSATYVRYVPSSIDPATAPDGSIWGAEGPYQAQCYDTSVPGYHIIRPVLFEGSVWRMAPPDPGECDDTRIYYDPAEPPPECSGGGGGGDPANETCIYDYICIDVWNDQTGMWEEYWCGYANVCS